MVIRIDFLFEPCCYWSLHLQLSLWTSLSSSLDYLICFLCQDESTLIWYSGKEPKQVKLNQVSKIIPGQRTVSYRLVSLYVMAPLVLENILVKRLLVSLWTTIIEVATLSSPEASLPPLHLTIFSKIKHGHNFVSNKILIRTSTL